jgi:hypothetical protein
LIANEPSLLIHSFTVLAIFTFLSIGAFPITLLYRQMPECSRVT